MTTPIFIKPWGSEAQTKTSDAQQNHGSKLIKKRIKCFYYIWFQGSYDHEKLLQTDRPTDEQTTWYRISLTGL